MSFTADLINELARDMKEAATYLEIGVFAGTTFFGVDLPFKVAVDPQFRFKPEEHQRAGQFFLPITSDDFFAAWPGPDIADYLAERELDSLFDLVYLDGLHTFEQTYRDLKNSLRHTHDKSILLLDDTVPADPYSALPDQDLSLAYRRQAGLDGRPWHGDAYKVVLAIHDFHHELSYCTIMNHGNPQTLVWRAPRHLKRRPVFASLAEIAGLDYFAVLKYAGLFQPVDREDIKELLGRSLAPATDKNPEAWRRMIRPIKVATRPLYLKNYLERERREQGQLALWGVGGFLQERIDPDWLTHPNIHLVDSSAAGSRFGSKEIESPEIIDRLHIRRVIISVFPGTDNHGQIEARLRREYGLQNLVSLADVVPEV